MGVVLGRRADHGRAANVDILDAHFVRPAARNRLLKGVEIHNQQINGKYAVLMHGVFMRGQVAVAEEAAVHHGMQSLDAAIHHFRKFCQLAHIFDRNTRRRNRAMRAARRDKFDAALMQSFRLVDEAGFIRNGEQRALDGRKASRIKGGKIRVWGWHIAKSL